MITSGSFTPCFPGQRIAATTSAANVTWGAVPAAQTQMYCHNQGSSTAYLRWDGTAATADGASFSLPANSAQIVNVGFATTISVIADGSVNVDLIRGEGP